MISRKQLLMACLAFLLTQVSLADDPALPDPDSWFRSNYGVLWEENAWDRLEDILAQFDRMVTYYPLAGDIEIHESSTFITEVIRDMKANGFQESQMTGYQFEPLSESAAAFRTRWIDRNFDGTELVNCWWYLAGTRDTRWVITSTAEIDCQTQGPSESVPAWAEASSRDYYLANQNANSEALAAMYSPDATILVSPNDPGNKRGEALRLQSQEAIEAYFRADFEHHHYNCTWRVLRVMEGQKLAAISGTDNCLETVLATGEASEVPAEWVSIYQKQPDGRWLVVFEQY